MCGSRGRGGAGGRRRPRAAEEEPPSRERRAADRGLLTRTGAGPRAPGPGGGRAPPRALRLRGSSRRPPRRRGECPPLLLAARGPRIPNCCSVLRPSWEWDPPTHTHAGWIATTPLPRASPTPRLFGTGFNWEEREIEGDRRAAAPRRGGGSPETFSALSGIRQPGGPGMPGGRARRRGAAPRPPWLLAGGPRPAARRERKG